jgi:Ca2+-binding EF-hand superfamily protein
MGYFGTKMGSDRELVLAKVMKRLDANKDGKLDQEEFGKLFSLIVARNDLNDRAKAKFKELDTDSSGYLESAEIDAVVTWSLAAFPNDGDLQTYKKHLLLMIDANKDGKIDMDVSADFDTSLFLETHTVLTSPLPSHPLSSLCSTNKQEFIVLFEDLVARLELIERAREKFQELDTDKSGVLERAELDKVCDWVLAAYGEKTEDELVGFKATLMKRIDVNGDEKISLPEFAVLFEEICTRMDLLAQAKKAFNELDKDQSGFLEKEELGKVLVHWAEQCGARIGLDPKQPLEELLGKLDANSDGKLSLTEFLPLFQDVTTASGMWAAP